MRQIDNGGLATRPHSGRMRFVNPSYSLSELTRDVIAGFYRSYDAFGFGFLESAYRRVIRDDRREYPIAAR